MKPHAKTDEYDDGGNLEQDHHVIRFSRFANPRTRITVSSMNDQKRRPMKPKSTRADKVQLPEKSLKPLGGTRGKSIAVRTHAEPVKQTDNMRENPTLTAMLLTAYSSMRSQQ